MASNKESSREIGLSRSQENATYICPSATKEDSEQSNSSSSSANSPTEAAKTLDISSTLSSSAINSRGRSPVIADERPAVTPGKYSILFFPEFA